jgi:hypothetical protein
MWQLQQVRPWRPPRAVAACNKRPPLEAVVAAGATCQKLAMGIWQQLVACCCPLLVPEAAVLKQVCPSLQQELGQPASTHPTVVLHKDRASSAPMFGSAPVTMFGSAPMTMFGSAPMTMFGSAHMNIHRQVTSLLSDWTAGRAHAELVPPEC